MKSPHISYRINILSKFYQHMHTFLAILDKAISKNIENSISFINHVIFISTQTFLLRYTSHRKRKEAGRTSLVQLVPSADGIFGSLRSTRDGLFRDNRTSTYTQTWDPRQSAHCSGCIKHVSRSLSPEISRCCRRKSTAPSLRRRHTLLSISLSLYPAFDDPAKSYFIYARALSLSATIMWFTEASRAMRGALLWRKNHARR